MKLPPILKQAINEHNKIDMDRLIHSHLEWLAEHAGTTTPPSVHRAFCKLDEVPKQWRLAAMTIPNAMASDIFVHTYHLEFDYGLLYFPWWAERQHFPIKLSTPTMLAPLLALKPVINEYTLERILGFGGFDLTIPNVEVAITAWRLQYATR
jgi:hypothetical protein